MKQKQIDKINEKIKGNNFKLEKIRATKYKKFRNCNLCYKKIDYGNIIFMGHYCLDCGFKRLDEKTQDEYYQKEKLEVKESYKEDLKELKETIKNYKKDKNFLNKYKEKIEQHNLIEAL